MLTRLVAGLLAALVALSAAPFVQAPTADASGRPPVHDYDFPDPEVIRVGSTYYAYSTNVLGFWGSYINLPVLQSTDLETWSLVADGLRYSNSAPSYGSWVDPSEEGRIWAPGVEQFGSKFVVYYTAPHAASGKQCVGRAVSSSPTGPFVDNTSSPLKCQTSEGGTIDADTYRDGDTTWLLFKNDGNCCGEPIHLWAQKLTSNGLSLTGSASKILSYSQAWEYPLIEQPAMVDGPGGQFLFYSGNWWESSSYAIGYAKCSSVSSCSKKTLSGPWMSSTTYAKGPGAADFFTDPSTEPWFTYHGWSGGTVGYPFGRRAMFMEKVDLGSSTPQTDPSHPYPTSGAALPPPGFSATPAAVNGSYLPLSGDFDGDGFWDIFWYGPGSAYDSLWRGKPGPGFSRVDVNVNGSYIPITGDFDADGRTDILWYGPGSAKDALWLGRPGGAFASGSVNVNGNYTPVSGDFDGDGHDDILWYGPGGAYDALWRGRPGAVFTGYPITVNGVYEPFAGDFNGNGRWDIFWYGPGASKDSIWLGHATPGSFSTRESNVNGRYTPVTGDFNGDQTTDIIWYGPGSDYDAIWFAQTDVTFSPGPAVSITGVYAPTSGDFDSDNDDDIMWYRAGTGSDTLWWAE